MYGGLIWVCVVGFCGEYVVSNLHVPYKCSNMLWSVLLCTPIGLMVHSDPSCESLFSQHPLPIITTWPQRSIRVSAIFV